MSSRKEFQRCRGQIKKAVDDSIKENKEAMEDLLCELGIDGDVLSDELIEEAPMAAAECEGEDTTKHNGGGWLKKFLGRKK